MEAGPKGIAQAERENLLFDRWGHAKEGIIAWDRIGPIGFNMDAQDLAEQGLYALGVAIGLHVTHRIVVETAAVAASDIEVAFVAGAVAEAHPVKVMIGLWLIGSQHRHFSRRVGKVGIGAHRKARDVGYAHMENAVTAAGPVNVEVAVGRVIGIESHPKDSGALTLADFESDIEKGRLIHRSR